MSDSDSDDLPLSRKVAVAKRPPPTTKSGTVTSAAKATSAKPSPAKAANLAIKKEAVVKNEPAVKKETGVKKEPVSKATGAKVKKEAQSNGASKGAKPAKAVKAEGETKVVREKKEYEMPGQTRDTPAETDALRKYYTSLLQQRPGSQLALKWCMQHGLLPREEALKLMGAGKLKSPMKSENGRSAGVKRAADTKAAKPPAKKAKAEPASKPKAKAAPAKSRAKKAASSSEDDADSDSESESDDDQPLSKRIK